MQKRKNLKKNRDLCFPFQPFKHISKMLIHHSKVHGLHEKGFKRFFKNRFKKLLFSSKQLSAEV
jgi:hypothetical protein